MSPTPPEAPEIERDELLALLRKRGVRLSRYQLLRWQNWGLMPRPRRKGKGQGRGVRLLYPTGAVLQAGMLAVLLDQDRRRDEAGWVLWCMGFPVTPVARNLLLRELDLGGKNLLATLAARDAVPRTFSPRRRRPGTGSRGRAPYPFDLLSKDSVPGVIELGLRTLAGQAMRLPNASDDRWLHASDVLETVNSDPALDGGGQAPSPELVREGALLLAREASLPQTRRALASIPDRQLIMIRNEAQFRWEQVVTPMVSGFAAISRIMFLQYFVFRHVSPTAAKATLEGIRQLGWTRPPLSPIARAVEELRAEARPEPLSPRKKVPRGSPSHS